jgi:two-component system sensor histidine kinase KdpD
MAVLGVAVASALIALIEHVVRFSNISLLYLLVVLWLATRYGRGPAIAASVLAFLAYDFFFIPPLYQLTIDDPTEWISLSALLATSLALGQLTAAVQARAREAQESQRRTATLYALSELIASTSDFETLLSALVKRILETFAPDSVLACALILPDEQHEPLTRALAPAAGAITEPLTLIPREQLGQASWTLEHGRTVGGTVHLAGVASPEALYCFFMPLASGRQVVGALGLVGGSAVHALVAPVGQPSAGAANHSARRELLAACCRQIAVALDRAELQREAVHAEALRESDRLKDALLGSVTHDLRTPLAAIEVAGESLLEPDVEWSDEERHEFAETIVTSAGRLSRLVNNLLDLSRLEAGVAVPEKQLYPIGDVIATVLDRLELTGRTEGRTIEVTVDDDVPAVPMDHAQMEEVMTNLIENALKYSPPEGGIRIDARTLHASGEVEVRVSDQGIGIPPGELQAIFDKFYRVQHVQLPWATKRPPTGTGLGLAISAAILREHDGRIWAESKPGDGATFVFTLPIPQELGPEPPGGEQPVDETHGPSYEATPATEPQASSASIARPAADGAPSAPANVAGGTA